MNTITQINKIQIKYNTNRNKEEMLQMREILKTLL